MATGEPSLRDARAVLGVTAAATPAQVVTAFRRQARAVHPDVSHAQNAAPRFAALVAAYHVALQAAHGESGGPDLDTGARTPVSADPPRADVTAWSPAPAERRSGRPAGRSCWSGRSWRIPRSHDSADGRTPAGSGTRE